LIIAKSFLNKTVAVMGLARSGRAVISSLALGGAKVLAWDDDRRRREEIAGFSVEISNLYNVDFSCIDALVLSPGIPHSFPKPHPLAAKAKASGVPIIGDIEIFIKSVNNTSIIGVTGTNGKSTTTLTYWTRSIMLKYFQ
jgi:UDP-N-acetylmuramoylalanine-D-glutamate ligase